ncbi:MAG: slipin family protein [bacterium]|nr:slipin family protein [bacterium]
MADDTPNKGLFGLQQQFIVKQYERALLYKDGKFERLLEAGKYTFWRWEAIELTYVSMRQMSEVISGQEMLTADKIGVRVSLIAQYVVDDPIKAINVVENFSQQLYQDLQLELRNQIAGSTIDQLLETRAEMGDTITQKITPLATEYGITLKRVGIRDIVLPGNVRTVMMEEFEAERSGRADLIKARHEVASARARANTAKILSENPNVMRMQELDALVKLASKQGNVVMLPDLASLFVRKMADDKGE